MKSSVALIDVYSILWFNALKLMVRIKEPLGLVNIFHILVHENSNNVGVKPKTQSEKKLPLN